MTAVGDLTVCVREWRSLNRLFLSLFMQKPPLFPKSVPTQLLTMEGYCSHFDQVPRKKN